MARVQLMVLEAVANIPSASASLSRLNSDLLDITTLYQVRYFQQYCPFNCYFDMYVYCIVCRNAYYFCTLLSYPGFSTAGVLLKYTLMNEALLYGWMGSKIITTSVLCREQTGTIMIYLQNCNQSSAVLLFLYRK